MTDSGLPGRWDAILEQSASAFLAAHLADPPSEPETASLAGTVVGRYRLLEEVGRGGMGSVWLAERADGQYQQRVALKLVKRGMDTDEILARFVRERQILARLEHPNIARLLDGGVADDGRPYFVMEYAAGEPITTYCDARRLPIPERLRLVIETCRAVQYAHRSLIVHRDLKPSNVMVTGDGTVKLLDFGVAKLLEDDSDATTATRSPLTPEYASPEQLTGAPITTATDVFQLGVLLYELVSGHRPWPKRARHARRRGPEADPPRPSTVARAARLPDESSRVAAADVSANRAATPDRLERSLRGDLDSIAMMALRHEPEARYASAEALADDLERHLRRQPVRARDASLAARASMFVRRHRGRVTAGLVTALLLLGAAAFYTVRIRQERDLAVREAAKSAQVAELVRQIFADWNPDAANRGEVSAASILRNAAQRVDTELRDQPAVLAASLSTLGELFMHIGASTTGDSLLIRALALQEDMTPSSNPDLAATLARRGRLLLDVARVEESIAVLTRALAMHESLFGPRQVATLRVRRDLALARRTRGDHVEAARILQDVVATLSPVDRRSPFGLEVAADLGYLFFLQARYDEAVELLRPTLERQRAILGPQAAAVLLTSRYLASSLRDRGDLDEAERLYRDALRIASNLYGATHVQTAYTRGVLSMLFERRGALADAEQLLHEELAVLDSASPTAALEVIRLGAIRLDRGDTTGAERWLRAGLDSLRKRYPSGNADEADALNRLSYILLSRGSPDAAEWYRQAAAFDEARPAGAPVFVSDGIHFLAWSHHREGDLAAAERVYRRALDLYRAQLPAGHPYTAFAMRELGIVQSAMRR